MNDDLNKQEQILSTLGLKGLMNWQASGGSIFEQGKFKNYVTAEYRESQRKEADEVHRMFELNILHIISGIRLTLLSCESYDGDTVEYKVIRMFIITSFNKELEVTDVNFENKIIYTQDLEIPFAETNKIII